jgi:2-dehydropantoate 2-reductase
VLEIDVADSPASIDWTGAEVVLLTTKSHDTRGALQALRAAAPSATPIVCMQNGVDNERQALRVFENVYGAVVMVPAAHIEPGVVQAHASRLTGIIDIGRYPDGVDERCEAIVEALEASRFSSRAHRDVMRRKHAKLLLNLANAVGAIARLADRVARDRRGPQTLEAQDIISEVGEAAAAWTR